MSYVRPSFDPSPRTSFVLSHICTLHVIEGRESAHNNILDVFDPVEAMPGAQPTRLDQGDVYM